MPSLTKTKVGEWNHQHHTSIEYLTMEKYPPQHEYEMK